VGSAVSDWLIQFNPWLRGTSFVGLLLILMLAEVLRPRRDLKGDKVRRWFDNISLSLINTVIVHVGIPVTLIALALELHVNGWGLFNQFELPFYLNVVIAFLLLDFAIYWQHRLFHTNRWLWKLHQVHHSDIDFDITTAVRFHPLEILLSLVIKIFAIALIGAPVVAVIVFELVLSSAALFNHANINLPPNVDKFIRFFLVTTDMHRVHHSSMIKECNSNFGFNLPWWDRLLGTYQAQPTTDHAAMSIGLPNGDKTIQEKLWWLLKMPFTFPIKTTN